MKLPTAADDFCRVYSFPDPPIQLPTSAALTPEEIEARKKRVLEAIAAMERKP